MCLNAPFALLAGVTICAQPLPSPDVLEPSVANEVEHALDVADANVTNAPTRCVGRLPLKEGMSATEQAIALVSAQRADGRWYDGTNDVTALAVERLQRLRISSRTFFGASSNMSGSME